MLPNAIRKTFQFGQSTVTLETARIARQAEGAVLCTIDQDTMVLAAVTAAKEVSAGQDFFPLSVHYQEKYYAVGKIPGGYLKREGRPSEKETLTSRLIDRPIRPLFPKGFLNEVQVLLTVVSANKQVNPDIAAMLAASAALSISGIPFDGPMAAARVGFDAQQGYVLNPTYAQLQQLQLDMVVAGTADAVLMVESEAQQLSEDQMLGAILFAHQEFQVAIDAIAQFKEQVGKPAWAWQPARGDTALIQRMDEQLSQAIDQAYQIHDKMQRHQRLNELRTQAVAQFAAQAGSQDADDDAIKQAFAKIEKKQVRQRVLQGLPRIDGRDNQTVRPLAIEVGVLPGTHGSALFTRGETQALAVATLGTTRDAQMMETLSGTITDSFMFHYNFPPYSVGETGRIGAVGRREIGHGRLARRGVQAVMPTLDSFPYSIRVVSEITESNGSSSMASVCGSSLALMDAGVPLRAAVAGIAMGLVKEGNEFAVLTDILGDEDHLGDMDFKVAGTAEGITALQMDIKIQGITEEIMEIALDQAHRARMVILQQMNQIIDQPRAQLSANAPVMKMIKIDTDKIRDVIGKGGATIRSIIDETGAEVDIEDNGDVKIYAPSHEAAQAAEQRIQALTAEVEVGQLYAGKVVRLADFGAFVNILPGKDGLVHISQIVERRLQSVDEELSEGQQVIVKCLDVDQRGRIKLSIKEVSEQEKQDFAAAN